MSSEPGQLAAQCRRMAAEFKQKAETASVPANKDLYAILENGYSQLASAYEEEGELGRTWPPRIFPQQWTSSPHSK